MKLSAILSAKSELANEIETKIEWLLGDIKSYRDSHADSDMPAYVVSDIEKSELKVKYLEAILKTLPDLK